MLGARIAFSSAVRRIFRDEFAPLLRPFVRVNDDFKRCYVGRAFTCGMSCPGDLIDDAQACRRDIFCTEFRILQAKKLELDWESVFIERPRWI